MKFLFNFVYFSVALLITSLYFSSSLDARFIKYYSFFGLCNGTYSATPAQQNTIDALLSTYSQDCQETHNFLKNQTTIQIMGTQDKKITDLSPIMSFIHLEEIMVENAADLDFYFLIRFKKLRKLRLDHVQMESLEGLAILKDRLEVLEVLDMPLNDVSFLKGFTRLRRLFLIDTEVTDLQPLEKLSSLRSLGLGRKMDISHRTIFDLSPLSSLIGLTELSLWNTGVKSITPLMSLGNLKELFVDGNVELSNLEAIKYLENLEAFTYLCTTLSPNNKLEACSTEVLRDLSPLSQLKWIKKLNLTNSYNLNLKPLSGLPRLTDLTLKSSQLSHLQSLRSLPSLEKLVIKAKNAESELMLFHPSAKLNHLRILNSPLSNLDFFKRYGGLKKLAILRGYIENIEPLAYLVNLEKLYLTHSKISNWNPLQNLSYLTSLRVRKNNPSSSIQCPVNAKSAVVARFCQSIEK